MVFHIHLIFSSNSTSVIDGRTNKIVDTIVLSKSPFGVAVNPNTNLIFVSYSGNTQDTISVIDGNTNKVLGDIKVGKNPQEIAVNLNSNGIYVVNSGGYSVSFIELSTIF